MILIIVVCTPDNGQWTLDKTSGAGPRSRGLRARTARAVFHRPRILTRLPSHLLLFEGIVTESLASVDELPLQRIRHRHRRRFCRLVRLRSKHGIEVRSAGDLRVVLVVSDDVTA